jgi:uncharacterized protein
MAKGFNSKAVIDPKRPWSLPRGGTGFPAYLYTKTKVDWDAVCAKASAGNAEAEFDVATCYDDGCKDSRGRILVRCSASRALAWYRRAAGHGSVSAQNTLGVILGGNYGVKRNARRALFWLKKAFRGGETRCAANNIAITHRESGNFRLAVRWFRAAVAEGDDGDLVQLGIHLYWGKGVRTGHAEAVRCFRKATHGKYISEWERDDAFFYLGIAYAEGKGARKSLALARKCFERANKDNDHLAAQRLLKKLARMADARR